MLCRAAVLSSRPMGGALGLDRPSGPHVAVRLPAGNLVVPTQAGAAMILGAPAAAAVAQSDGAHSVTIDDIFGGHARRRPDALALIDAANRETFTDRAPHRLTYSDADRIVTAIAARLRQ